MLILKACTAGSSADVTCEGKTLSYNRGDAGRLQHIPCAIPVRVSLVGKQMITVKMYGF